MKNEEAQELIHENNIIVIAYLLLLASVMDELHPPKKVKFKS
jgi:hypothetical protein